MRRQRHWHAAGTGRERRATPAVGRQHQSRALAQGTPALAAAARVGKPARVRRQRHWRAAGTGRGRRATPAVGRQHQSRAQSRARTSTRRRRSGRQTGPGATAAALGRIWHKTRETRHTRSGQAASIPRPVQGTHQHSPPPLGSAKGASVSRPALVRIAPYQPSRSQAPKARGCEKNFPAGSETNQGSRDESQRIAAWKLLYRVRHPDPYVSRLQTIPHSDVGSSRDLDSKEACSLL